MDVVVSANRLTAYSFFLSVSLSAFTQWGNQNNYSSSKIRWVIDTDIEFNFFCLVRLGLKLKCSIGQKSLSKIYTTTTLSKVSTDKLLAVTEIENFT